MCMTIEAQTCHIDQNKHVITSIGDVNLPGTWSVRLSDMMMPRISPPPPKKKKTLF